ncbi:MAG: hypothetical protein HY738_12005 [Bacteroidia bacterium]|nr:hypothetical protein [Bacteroidia bacterium]
MKTNRFLTFITVLAALLFVCSISYSQQTTEKEKEKQTTEKDKCVQPSSKTAGDTVKTSNEEKVKEEQKSDEPQSDEPPGAPVKTRGLSDPVPGAEIFIEQEPYDDSAKPKQ